MNPPRRFYYHRNPRLQWLHPPMNPHQASPTPVPAHAMTGIEPERWATELTLLLDRVCASDVGRAVVLSVARRTDIYQGRGDAVPGTYPDTLHGTTPLEATAQAETIGFQAALFIDLGRPPLPTEAGLVRTLENSLLHELVHAVNITTGNYRRWTTYVPAERERFRVSSPEEAMAWVIENMYRVEVGLPARSSYDANSSIPAGAIPTRQNTHTPLTEIESRIVERTDCYAPMLARRLEALPEVPVRYNPFRTAAGATHPATTSRVPAL